MGRRAVITGIGVVNPAGIGKDAFWRSMVEGRSALAPISRFDASRFPVRVAGQINGFEAKDFIPRRFIVKTDRFTHFALAAAELALADARLDLGNEDLHRVGVWFGNNAGGWDICERGFHELYREGATLVNPWQATAWFPTAPQGYLTIRYGIRGYSKSFVCDRASGASALYFAERAIRLGHNDVILAGDPMAGQTILMGPGDGRDLATLVLGALPIADDSVVLRTIYSKKWVHADALWNYQVQPLADYQARLTDKKNGGRNAMLRYAESDDQLEKNNAQVNGLSRVNIAMLPGWGEGGGGETAAAQP